MAAKHSNELLVLFKKKYSISNEKNIIWEKHQAVCNQSWTIVLVPLSDVAWGVDFNTPGPEQNGRHGSEDISNVFSWKKNDFFYSYYIVTKGPIEDIFPLGLVITWNQIGDKPLPEPMFTKI